MHDKNLAHFLQMLFVLNKQLKIRDIYLINDLTYLYRNLFWQQESTNDKKKPQVSQWYYRDETSMSDITYIHTRTHTFSRDNHIK